VLLMSCSLDREFSLDVLLIVPLFALLGVAVCSDLRTQRIPNLFLLLGVTAAAAVHVWLSGVEGLIAWGGGLAAGLLCFLPFYMLGGMAAGDVKLIAVAGSYLGVSGAFLAVAFSLMAGTVLGLGVLFYKKQLFRSLQRYWTIASLRTYIDPPVDDAARQRFPYAVAILLGSLLSVYFKLTSAGI
jgi:prepilin peptidase CpaA